MLTENKRNANIFVTKILQKHYFYEIFNCNIDT